MPDNEAQITITAQNNASAQLQEVADDLQKLNETAGGETPTALSNMESGVQKATTSLGGMSKEAKVNTEEMNTFKDALREVAPEIGRFGDGAAIAYGAAIAGLIEFAKSSAEAADELEAVHNRASVIFGEDFPKMEKAADAMGEKFNRSSSDILQYETSMGAVLKGQGLVGTSMEDLSQKLASLVVNFASFNHLDEADALQKVQMGLAGMGKGLQIYGLDVKDTTLAEYAHKLGIDEKVASMSEAEKVYLRANMILQETTYLDDDAAIHATSLSNATKSAAGAWTDLKEEVGGVIDMPIAQWLEGATTLMKLFGLAAHGAANELKSMRSLFDSQIIAADHSLPILPKDVGTGLDLADGGLKGLTYTVKGHTEATKEQAEAVAKANKEIKDHAQALGAAGGAADSAAGSAQDLTNEMQTLGDQYESMGQRIDNAVDSLTANHINKMASVDESIRRAMDSIRNLGQTYQTEMDRINETKLDKVADQMKVVQDLKDKVAGNQSSAGGLSQDQLATLFTTWNANKSDRNSQTATEQDALHLFGGGFSSSELSQLNDFIKLQREQSALTTYTASHPEVSTTAATSLSQESSFTREGAKLDEEQAQKTKDYQISQQQKQEEIKQLQAKRNEEIIAYTSARGQYAQTQIAFTTFHNDYVSKIQNMATVTKSAVATMKADLKELADSLAAAKPTASAAAASSTMNAINRNIQLQPQY